MVLYRDITYDEYNELCDGKVKKKINIYGTDCNTFNYKVDEYCIHFYRYLRHAMMYLHLFGEMTIKYEIPDDKIVDCGFGIYSYKTLEESVAIPEVIIKKEDYVLDNIIAINPDLTNDDALESYTYDVIIKELYKDWRKGKREKLFYEYLMDYFKEVDLDTIMNIYLRRSSKKSLIKRR